MIYVVSTNIIDIFYTTFYASVSQFMKQYTYMIIVKFLLVLLQFSFFIFTTYLSSLNSSIIKMQQTFVNNKNPYQQQSFKAK